MIHMLSTTVCLPVLGGNSAGNVRKHGVFGRYLKSEMLHNGFENEKTKVQYSQIKCLQGLSDCFDMY